MKKIKLLWLIILVISLSGCSTPLKPAFNSYTTDALFYNYNNYEIEIISDPSGVKIEWDNNLIGVTPLKRVINGETGFVNYAIIKAYPVYNGQYVQTKIIEHPFPRTIYFNMNLVPNNYNINIKEQ